MSDEQPDWLGRAGALLAGARNAEDLGARLCYAAQARLALDAAVTREKALRIQVDALERHLVDLAKAAK